MWYIRQFDELNLYDFEQILRMRQSIFILEQKSFFEDIDGNDKKAIHIFNKENDNIWAYVRLLIYDDKIILGRVTVNKAKRGNGSGRQLLTKALEYCDNHFPNKNIEIVAMSYLRKFYNSLGFVSTSDVYIMDDHPHEDMILRKN
ncbi:GNAT family N-acetyltransferase [Jeotgalicoccus sp. ATCC 8456]|uniref:GNAT family N-acetyltransferase n=1 Tax=Jeotgalicoccus sp. ATCC 8456 TaxID=946435 RepID=UPI0018E6017D|nr:GNAT family N-acetyltransferase [Jeotgalicoccus sp. ATCC 8456]QQD85651.1 GNAT family N-acetyltransferase [Jeotgalicoccus sp. ATCC 8456]